MERKTLGLCLLLTFLGGIYVYRFTDWFDKKAIQVSVSFRPLRQAAAQEALPVVFGLDQDHALKTVVVSELDAADTNKVVRPVWKLEASQKTSPTRGFLYGDLPEGMKESPVPGVAQPLKAGTSYRVELSSKSAKGSAVFQARGGE
jgi:hypothetical protein